MNWKVRFPTSPTNIRRGNGAHVIWAVLSQGHIQIPIYHIGIVSQWLITTSRCVLLAQSLIELLENLKEIGVARALCLINLA